MILSLPETKAYEGEEFIHGRTYLVGHVTSGDHPIQWGVYERGSGPNNAVWRDESGHWLNPEDDELSEADLYYLLPITYLEMNGE